MLMLSIDAVFFFCAGCTVWLWHFFVWGNEVLYNFPFCFLFWSTLFVCHCLFILMYIAISSILELLFYPGLLTAL